MNQSNAISLSDQPITSAIDQREAAEVPVAVKVKSEPRKSAKEYCLLNAAELF